MCSSCARVSLMSVSLPEPVASYLSWNSPRRWTANVRRFCRTRADALRKYWAVSSSFVRRIMLVLGAEDTSSRNPRPTVRSCGMACSENRKAVLVPRAVCTIWAKLE